MRHLVLRKHPKSRLWNKEYHKWNDRDKEEFEFLKTGKRKEVVIKEKIVKVIVEKPKKIVAEKKEPIRKSNKRVMRIADGKEYDSICDAARENGMHHTTIRYHFRINKPDNKFKFI